MSNVLIGIIGVILFIGLALAGALFLGPRFQEATQNSQAAGVMSALKQASDAAELRLVDLGVSTTPATDASFLTTGGYLKTIPVNPAPAARTSTGYLYSIQFNNNIYVDGYGEPQYAARYVMTPVGRQDDQTGKGICGAISRTYGDASIPETSDNFPDPAKPMGCMLANGADGRWYIAYSRLRSNAEDPNPASNWVAGQP